MATMRSNANHNGYARHNGHGGISGRGAINGHGGINGYGRINGHGGINGHAEIQRGARSEGPAALDSAAGHRAAGRLRGKVAIVTGADSGIGRAVALAFAREGADVAILYYSHDGSAEETRKDVEDVGRRALTIRGDISDETFCKGAAQQVVDELGHLDILVSSAALQLCTDDVQVLSREQLERMFRVNVFGYFFMVQACLPFMSAGSSIVATGSEAGIFGSQRLPDYSATQGAIHALTRSLAQQLMPKGIRVNAVAPRPAAQPEQIARTYVFLASNADSSFSTGQVLAELGSVTP